MDRRPLQSLLPGSGNNSNAITSNRSARAERLGRNKITRVGTACEACKRRRSKCSGLPAPCKLCLQSGIECTFDPSLDGRRAVHREDREALLSQNRLLTALLQAVRFRSSSQVDAVIRSIRENDPADDIFVTIQECLRQLDDGETATSVADGLPDDLQSQLQGATSVKESAPEDLNDMVYLGRRTRGREPLDIISIPVSHDDGEDGIQPGDQLKSNFYSSYNQPPRTPSSVLSPPESAHEQPVQPVVEEQSPRQSGVHSGTAHHIYEEVPSDSIASSSRPQNNASNLQHNRRGWHFALRTSDSQKAHSSGDPTDTQPEETHQTDASYQLVAQHAQAGEAGDTGITPFVPGTDAQGHNARRYLHDRVSQLYGVQTLVMQENTPLSDIITGFMDNAKTLLSQDASPPGVLGSDLIDVELFFRDRNEEDGFTVSGWACEVWRSFHDWDVYVRLAQILAYTAVMRWMLVPTADSYAAIPAILKPRPIQYLVPHHIALDFLPLPPLREALIKNLRDWMTALPAAPLSVNWDRGMDEAVRWDEHHRRRVLSQDFVDHVTNYQNWSIGESILGTFPEVKGLIRLDKQ
ncbi:hypothetical protein Z517_10691 [Fonsecaea pedrosoi CBS 271.37]|uniref:Zn(2)-C6 fungal-type domain-containing protein n=1 Tax=Fonsecaea pedrosoi CBS 271.37 TaxID=1442368 RepID=A0A0D2DE65_9EURO|nr:uncharacterized protein Z517_10691 [Fonsecaea pedrosoi CBS 271.37]KIW75946.1 hypothetical protein Z517_10691 [Fonsecaea pedrosoi CBS 271.37]